MWLCLFHDVPAHAGELQKAASEIWMQIEASGNIRNPSDFKSTLPVDFLCIFRGHLHLGRRVRVQKPSLMRDTDARIRVSHSVRGRRVQHYVRAFEWSSPAFTEVECSAKRKQEICEASTETGSHPEPYGGIMMVM